MNGASLHQPEPEQPREIGPVDKVSFTVDHLLAHLQIEADFVVDRALTPAEVRQVAEAWTALADQLDAESGPRGSALGADTHLRHARICHCLDESDRCCQPSCDCHDEPEDS